MPSHYGATISATSCRGQAMNMKTHHESRLTDLIEDCAQALADHPTRNNTPKIAEKRTKLVLKSQPVDIRIIEEFNSSLRNGKEQKNGPRGLVYHNDSSKLDFMRPGFQGFSVSGFTSEMPNIVYQKPGSESLSTDEETKYKTELCRNYEITGKCKYGSKCSYAHGKDELVNKKHINLHYKSKKCNKFFERGFCEYGARCQYLHKEDSFTHILDSYCEKLLVWMERNPQLDMSSIMKKTHSYWNRNSFFTKLEQTESCQDEEQEHSS